MNVPLHTPNGPCWLWWVVCVCVSELEAGGGVGTPSPLAET